MMQLPYLAADYEKDSVTGTPRSIGDAAGFSYDTEQWQTILKDNAKPSFCTKYAKKAYWSIAGAFDTAIPMVLET